MSIPFTWVYLIHDPFTDLYKIGKADNPKARLREFTRKPGTILPTPNDFVIYEAWFCPERKEHEFHKRFEIKRRRGEWFELSDDDVREIEYELVEYGRFVREFSALVEQLISRVADAMNSSHFYAQGMGIFLNAGIKKSGDPFMFGKQLTTSLPNEKWFDDHC